jgi:hypothetical protein
MTSWGDVPENMVSEATYALCRRDWVIIPRHTETVTPHKEARDRYVCEPESLVTSVVNKIRRCYVLGHGTGVTEHVVS